MEPVAAERKKEKKNQTNKGIDRERKRDKSNRKILYIFDLQLVRDLSWREDLHASRNASEALKCHKQSDVFYGISYMKRVI